MDFDIHYTIKLIILPLFQRDSDFGFRPVEIHQKKKLGVIIYYFGTSNIYGKTLDTRRNQG